MSIIYNTLERLETDNPPLAYNKGKASSPRLTVEPKGFSVKTVATAMMVVIAGTSLMLWHRSGEVGGPPKLASPKAVKQSVAVEKSDHELSPASIGEQPTVPLISIEPNSETPKELDAPPAMPTSTDMVAVRSKQRSAVKEESPGLDSIEEPVIVVDVSADTVSSPVAKLETTPTEPDERKQIPSSDTTQPGGVEEVIEQARIALSRGQYERALSTMETLAPVPGNRADFWLIKGSAHLGIGQLDQAEMAFASAQVLAPDNAQIAVQQAVLKQEKGDHTSALLILKDVAIRNPDVPEVFLNQGYSQQALGAERDAKRSFRTFLKMTESRSLYLQQRKVVKEWLAQVSSIQ